MQVCGGGICKVWLWNEEKSEYNLVVKTEEKTEWS